MRGLILIYRAKVRGRSPGGSGSEPRSLSAALPAALPGTPRELSVVRVSALTAGVAAPPRPLPQPAPATALQLCLRLPVAAALSGPRPSATAHRSAIRARAALSAPCPSTPPRPRPRTVVDGAAGVSSERGGGSEAGRGRVTSSAGVRAAAPLHALRAPACAPWTRNWPAASPAAPTAPAAAPSSSAPRAPARPRAQAAACCCCRLCSAACKSDMHLSHTVWCITARAQ